MINVKLLKLKKLKSRGCNVYLLKTGGKRILIDTGTPLSAKLIESQVGGEGIDAIVITHAHFDHIGSARFLHKKFGCDVFVHRDDLPYLLGEKKLRFSGILGRVATIGEKLFRIRYPDKAREIDELIEILPAEIEIIHTPGHTPGSICIRVEDKLLCGDLLRGRASLSPKAFCSDYSAYLSSVRSVAELDFSLALPGHGDPIPKKDIDDLIRKSFNLR